MSLVLGIDSSTTGTKAVLLAEDLSIEPYALALPRSLAVSAASYRSRESGVLLRRASRAMATRAATGCA